MNAVISIKQYIEHAHILIDVWVELSFSGVEGGGVNTKLSTYWSNHTASRRNAILGKGGNGSTLSL